MKDLAGQYDKRAAPDAGNDFLTQVGHTLRGKPISRRQFELMVDGLADGLELGPQDRLLDLCCGNGLVTRQLADKVAGAVGVDFSEGLIGVGRQHHAAPNIDYHVLDARRLDQLPKPEQSGFTKVIMHAALQHFRPGELPMLLQNILKQTIPDPVICFSYVPDHRKRHLFYDTPKRKLTRLVRGLLGTDIFGTWWRREDIERACRDLGRSCTFHDLDPRLEAARYRINVIVR